MNKEVVKYQKNTSNHPIRYFLPLILCLLTFLTGCVDYDVGVNFDSPYEGTIVQHIQISEQLTSLNQSETQQWLNSIKERAYQLRGKIDRISSQEMAVTIPFTNGTELIEKFNQFFYGDSVATFSSSSQNSTEIENVASKMSLQQSNLLLVERTHIDLFIDLRGLGAIANQGKIKVTPDSLAELTFQINAAWIARSLKGSNLLNPTKDTPGKIIWQLQPGQLNHIEAVVWLPSPVGIGTIIIMVLMIAGYYLKYKHFPGFAPTV